MREGQVRFDRLWRIAWIANDESANHEHSVTTNERRGFDAGVASGLFRLVLGACLEEAQVVVYDVFNPQKDVLEVGAPHERRQLGAMVRDGRGHRLHDIADVVQPRVDDGFAQRRKALARPA